MSIPVIRSISIGDGNLTDLLIEKPAGTVDGDLLIAVVGGFGTVSSAPSGWTLVEGETGNNSGTVYLYRKAASSEGADYTWVFSANNADGLIFRIDGHDATTPIGASNSTAETTVDNTSNPEFAIGITPAAGNSLLIIAVANDDDTSAGSVSTYAIATSDPSWTERLDVNPRPANGLACATATRLEASGTGNVSLTSTKANTSDWLGIFVSISPDPNNTVSPDLINLTATIQAPASVTGTSQANPNVIDATLSVQAPTVTTAASKIKNKDKSTASSITNKNKS